MLTIIHSCPPEKHAHCATIECVKTDDIRTSGTYIAYYVGSECTDKQKVRIDFHRNEKNNHELRATTDLPYRTGNCLLLSNQNKVYIIYSVFEDIDEQGNTPKTPVQRWAYCSNWIREITLTDTIELTKPKKLNLEPGHLVRCQAIQHINITRMITYAIPLYREHDCYGLIMGMGMGSGLIELGKIGKSKDESKTRFGKGKLIQPTLWNDQNGRLHSLSRNITPKPYAWYSYSDTNGTYWTEPEQVNVDNANNSLVTINQNTKNPILIWNLGHDRHRLVLGRYDTDTKTATPYLQLNIDTDMAGTGSYPNYAIDHLNRLHIVFTTNRRAITRIIIEENDLKTIEEKAKTLGKILTYNDLDMPESHQHASYQHAMQRRK